MITYIEFSDYSLFLEYICQKLCQKLSVPLLPVLINPSKLPCTKIRLQNWNQLEQNLSGGDFFQDTNPDNLSNDSTSTSTFVIDLDELEINKNTISYLTNPSLDTSLSIYLYSSTNDTLDADTKKLLKKANIDLESFKKPNPDTIQKIASEHCKNLNLSISTSKLNTLCSQSLSYYEILNNLEFLELAQDQDSAFESMLKHEKPALFMQGLNLNNLPKDINNWYKNVGEDDLQLALSLIYTKLEKPNTDISKKLLQNLIQTDQKIKTSSRVGAMTWYKLFLWKAKKLS